MKEVLISVIIVGLGFCMIVGFFKEVSHIKKRLDHVERVTIGT